MEFAELEALGVDRQEVMARFMNNEGFYTRILKKFLEDQSYGQLKNAFNTGSTEEAFRAAHTLKGVSANLGLHNIYALSSEITEQYRHGDADMQLVEEKLKKLDEQYSMALDIIKRL